jgi:hypothetical protein
LILSSSFLAGTMVLTKGSELFDKSAEPDEDDITLSIDWYEKEGGKKRTRRSLVLQSLIQGQLRV